MTTATDHIPSARELVAESTSTGTIARGVWTEELHAALIALADGETDTDSGHDYWGGVSDGMEWRVELRETVRL